MALSTIVKKAFDKTVDFGNSVTIYNTSNITFDSYSDEESRTYDSGTAATALTGPTGPGIEEVYEEYGKLSRQGLRMAFKSTVTLDENSIILYNSIYYVIQQEPGIIPYRIQDTLLGYLVILERKKVQSLD